MKRVYLSVVVLSALLAGCSSSASRLAECERSGVSRDTCYLAEQNRTSAINAAAEAQALKNANDAVQHAQMSKKHREELERSGCTQLQEANGGCNASKSSNTSHTITKHYNSMSIVWKQNDSVTVDGKPAALIESSGYGATWQQGIYKIITYKNLKIAVMQDDKFLGYAK